MPTITITARPLPTPDPLNFPGFRTTRANDAALAVDAPPHLALEAAALAGTLSRIVAATGQPCRLTVEVGEPEDPFAGHEVSGGEECACEECG